MFDYDMVALIRSNSRYIHKKITSESFRGTFYGILKDDKTLLSAVMDIYCRKKSGDFQFMGVYDGLSTTNHNGEYKSHVLRTADGNEYMFSEDGFVAVN